MQKYKYKAFISYRHIPFDAAVACHLLKLIETYTPPRSLRPPGKFENWRCFKDEEELPLSKDLGDDIHSALRNSEYLIIICSLHYNESKWCIEELRYFKELHKGSTENILVISIEGDPSKTFPEEVLTSFEDGKNRCIEPLSADIRADNEKQSLKKLDTLYLKMVARFLNCEYNDLIQRHEKRKRIRNTCIASISFAVLFAFVVVLSLSYLKVREKNEQIEKQNQALRIENAQHLVLESEILWNDSKMLDAVQTILKAMPSEENPIPLLPEVSYHLINQIGAYKPINFQQVKKITTNDYPSTLLLSDDGQTLITKEETFTRCISFWDTATGKLIRQYDMEDLYGDKWYPSLYQPPSKIKAELLENGRSPGKLISSGEQLYENYSITEISERKERHVYSFSQPTLYCFDENSGQILWRIDNICQEPVYGEETFALVTQNSENEAKTIQIHNMSNGVVLEKWNTELLSTYEQWTIVNYNEQSHCLLINVNHGKESFTVAYIIQSDELPKIIELHSLYNDERSNSVISDNTVYSISFNHNSNSYTSMGTFNVLACDLDNGNILWEQSFSDQSGNGHLGFLSAENMDIQSDYLYFINNNKITVILADTGEIIHQFIFSNNIIHFQEAVNGILLIITENGEEIAVPIKKVCSSNKSEVFGAILHNFTNNISCFARSNGVYATTGYDNIIYLYKDVKNPDYTELLYADAEKDEWEIYIIEVNPEQQTVLYCVQHKQNDIIDYRLLDLTSDEIKTIQAPELSIMQDELPEWFPKNDVAESAITQLIRLNETSSAVIMNNNTLRIYENETGSVIRTLDISFSNAAMRNGFSLNCGESILMIDAEGGIYKISSLTGQIEASTKIDKPEYSYCEKIQLLEDKVIVIFERNHKNYAWFLNLDNLSATLFIEDFMYYDEINNVVFIFEPYISRLGKIPLLAEEDLIRKAKQYLNGE